MRFVRRFRPALLVSFLFCVGWCSPAAAASDSGVAETGFISIFGVLLSSVGAFFVAKNTAKLTVAAERKRRQGDLALKISEMVSDHPDASRRFAIAVLKIIDGAADVGMVHFIPVNSRVTVGRDLGNDIVLTGDMKLSRFQCGFVSAEDSVFVEDYVSTNGTMVNAKRIDIQKLNSGDRIVVGDYEFLFKSVYKNELLLQ